MITNSRRHAKPQQAFRYPGGKRKIADQIRDYFPQKVISSFCQHDLSVYCEPFIGSGAMLASMLPHFPRHVSLVLGDADSGIAAYWRCAADPKKADALAARFIRYSEPTPDDFYRLKELDGTDTGDDVDCAFRKTVLHFISFSGVGAKAGGPIGGRKQSSKFNVNCRWKPERTVRNLMSLSYHFGRLASVRVCHDDFATTLAHVPSDGFAYLDPPYYLKGGELYVHNMTHEEHVALAVVLRSAPYEWVLSYDNHPIIHDLYSGGWAEIKKFKMTATIDSKRSGAKRRKNDELVIASPERVHDSQ